jgi:hypothetical protein
MTSAPATGLRDDSSTPSTDRPRTPRSIVVSAVAFGLLCGAFEITNTSIGWHIASGRWMTSNGQIMDRDVFSFTSGGAEWVDHEWLFQVIVATLFDLGGAPLLVLMRMLLVAALTVLLLRIGTSSGLDPPVALLLAVLCVLGARPRFFLRPELFTLVLLPLSLWLFSTRGRRRLWPLPLAAVIAAGANLHGGILVAPIVIAAWFAGEAFDALVCRDRRRKALRSGAWGVAAAAVAPLANPHGWQVWTVPFELAEMVQKPHIPNPEWLSPGPADAPWFYLALGLAVATLALASRSAEHWLTAGAGAALALKHIRNLGLFFVLLPQILAPSLARWSALTNDPSPAVPNRRIRTVLCLTVVAALAAAALLRPWPRAGFTFADRWYPDRAYAFCEANDLLRGRLYNDVRFGGWLILNSEPGRRVFLDDRNEVHEPLLEEIWQIFARSDVGAWQALLAGYRIDTVMLRYHEPIMVTDPDGRELGRRGFSALWFPTTRWAMVYWDDVAMILVRRESVSEDFMSEREYRVIRPDDLAHVFRNLEDDPTLRRRAETEVDRALSDDPGCRRADQIKKWLSPSRPASAP